MRPNLLLADLRLRRAVLACAAVASLVCATGCPPPVPTAEFSVYKQSFTKARTVSEHLYADYVLKKEAVDALNAEPDESAEDADNGLFDPQMVNAALFNNSPITIHIAAWEVMARYNAALTTIAEGKSAKEMANSVTALTENVIGLATVAGAAVPGLGLAVPVVKKFLELAGKARTEQEFKEAVQEAHPIIKRIINDVFIEDTVTFDTHRKLLADDRLLAAYDKLLVAAKSAAYLDSEHIPPPADSWLAKRRKAASERCVAIFQSFASLDAHEVAREASKRCKFGAAKKANRALTPYTHMVLSQLEQLIAEAEKVGKTLEAVKREREAYHSSLSDYVLLLRALEAGLDRLKTEVDQRLNMTDIVQAIDANAITLQARLRKAEAAASITSPRP